MQGKSPGVKADGLADGMYLWERPNNVGGFGDLIRVLTLEDGRRGWCFAYEGSVRQLNRLDDARLVTVVQSVQAPATC